MWITPVSGPLYRFALLRCGSADTAADVVQETFMGLLTDRFRFDPLRLSYYYLETSERVTVDKPSERLEEDRQTIVRVADGIRAELFPAKPDRMKCSGCDFKLLCPSAAV